MIVKIPKDIDATEAKIYANLSLKKLGFAALAGVVGIVGLFTLHLPIEVTAIPCGIVLFFGWYKKQGMSAFTIALRFLQSFLSKQEYQAETIATANIRTQKEQEKAAMEWNKELIRQKKRHPNAETIKPIRCTRSKKSRK
jgi:hypothetical protein